MEKKVFKYKIVKVVVIIFNFFSLLLFGFGAFDTYNLFKSEHDNTSPGEYFVFVLALLICLLSFVSLIMVLIKSSKSIRILNIFYGFVVTLFLASMLIQVFETTEKDTPLSDYLILAGLICTFSFLIILINKYKYRQVQYENIENLGKHND
ncbi:hypothetical protein [Chryseobacterium shigense]|uniref:FlaA1/EpsC-like NDP-sugar epimerase n=1 Tax=Chryseobacterium shigense TaxID=297244 RepID=A0A841NDX0_9FLAO|nr:hypothetical protein [Chryseobacterium shigense]MBB6369549.1 FlaA1/EpsC-like NDP-sugar epimerase [Chryseobacterium shigense]